jgi:hypothetical protein
VRLPSLPESPISRSESETRLTGIGKNRGEVKLKWRKSFFRRPGTAGQSHVTGRRLRGRGGPITFLAIAGILGVASGFALASPTDNTGNPPQACGDGTATRINEPTSDQTTSVAVIGGATLTFVFDNSPGGPYSATWTADAPFTGTILVKAGNEASGGGETTFTFSNATEGTVYSPFTNQNGQTLKISHVDTCGTGTTTHTTDTTLTTTLPNTTVTTTGPPTTSTVTGPPTTSTVTGPPTTSTITQPDTTTTITEPGTTSTVTQDTTTTTTGPDTTLTTTVPCLQQQSAVTPRSLTTITIGGTTITQTTPGTTNTVTEPGTTNTVTEPGTTQTVTQPGNTVTQTEPGSTDVTTVPGSTIVSTVPGQTNTVTDCTTSSTTSSTAGTTTTGGTEGTTTSGGSTSSVAGTQKKGGGNGGNGSVAGTAENASGGLPFTGLHVPLLIMLGLGMAATGLVLRKRLGSLE